MGTGRKPSAWCLRVLLAAVAVQGLTPDADDMASANLPAVLAAVLDRGAARDADDPTPPGDDGQDATPDEAAVLAGVVTHGLPRRETPGRFAPDAPRAGRPGPAAPAPGPRPRRRSGGGVPLIHRLCRLTC